MISQPFIAVTAVGGCYFRRRRFWNRLPANEEISECRRWRRGGRRCYWRKELSSATVEEEGVPADRPSLPGLQSQGSGLIKKRSSDYTRGRWERVIKPKSIHHLPASSSITRLMIWSLDLSQGTYGRLCLDASDTGSKSDESEVNQVFDETAPPSRTYSYCALWRRLSQQRFKERAFQRLPLASHPNSHRAGSPPSRRETSEKIHT